MRGIISNSYKFTTEPPKINSVLSPQIPIICLPFLIILSSLPLSCLEMFPLKQTIPKERTLHITALQNVTSKEVLTPKLSQTVQTCIRFLYGMTGVFIPTQTYCQILHPGTYVYQLCQPFPLSFKQI